MDIAVIRSYIDANTKKLLFGIIVLFILALFFTTFFKFLIAALFFVLLNVFIRKYQGLDIDLPLEIEFVTVATVLTTIKFGLIYGIIMAFLTWYFGESLNENMEGLYNLSMIVGYVFAAVFSVFISQDNLVIGGILVCILSNMIIFTLNHFFVVYDNKFENIISSLTNILSNSFFFLKLAPMIFVLLH